MRNATFLALSKVVHRSMSYEHSDNSTVSVSDLCAPLVVALLPTAADILSTSAAARAQLLTLLERWVTALPIYANRDEAISGVSVSSTAFSDGCDELSGPLIVNAGQGVISSRPSCFNDSLARRGSVRKNSIELIVRDLAPAAKRTLVAALQDVYSVYSTETPASMNAPTAAAVAAKGASPLKKATVSPKKTAPASTASTASATAHTTSENTKSALDKPRRVPISPTKKAKEATLGAPQRG